jgi:hypothetical protein
VEGGRRTMNIGDRFAVQIEGMDVAEAIIEDMDDGNATIVIPATRLVVRMRQSLDLAATKEPEVDRVFAGVETSGDNTSEAAEAANNAPQPVVEPVVVAPPVPEIGPYGEDVGEGIHSRKSFPGEMD